jgi:hypothetical protein
VSYRTLITLIATAVAWALLVQAPWSQVLGPAMIALGVIHLVYPFLAASRTTPLLVAAIDAGFLYYAFVSETWGELTIVFVPILAVAGVVALCYAAAVVILLHRRAARRAASDAE